MGYPEGECYIMTRDYQSLPQHGTVDGDTEGILYESKKQKNVFILRTYDGSFGAPLGSAPVMLSRDEDNVYILGDCYAIEKSAQRTLPLGAETHDSGRNYESEIETLGNDLTEIVKRIDGNMFVAEDDKDRIYDYVKEIFSNLAFTRQDTQKLYD